MAKTNKCKVCESALPDRATRCPFCYEATSETQHVARAWGPPEPQFSKCDACDAEIPGGAIRCPYCYESGTGCNAVRYLRLYRYRSLSTDNDRKYRRNTFVDNFVYFPTPSQFNDPFDCRFDISLDATPQEKVMAYFWYLHRREAMPIDEAMAIARREVLGRSYTELQRWEEHRRTAFIASIESHGIFSLSAVNNDILMWSHYADSHRGVCIEFTADACRDDHYRSFTPFPVQYQSQFPCMNMYGYANNELVCKSVLTKSEHWAYEQEYRILDAERSGLRQIPDDLLTGVIFGTRTPKEHREEVLGWIAERSSPVRVQEAKYCPGHYALDIRECE